MPIINGKRVIDLPNSVTGHQIKQSINETRPNRRILVKRPGGDVSISENQHVRLNHDDEIKIIPDRVKAYEFSYEGNKSDFQKQLIFSQVNDLEQKLFKSDVEIDPDYNWILVHKFKLPRAWAEVNDSVFTPLLLVIPDQFPDLPPNGFYLPNTINAPIQDNHFFDRGYGGAYGGDNQQIQEMHNKGWKWYCTHIFPEAWTPARIKQLTDWRKGDNLWDVFNMITDVLTDPSGD